MKLSLTANFFLTIICLIASSKAKLHGAPEFIWGYLIAMATILGAVLVIRLDAIDRK